MDPQKLPAPDGGNITTPTASSVDWSVDRTSKAKRFVASGFGIATIITIALLLMAGIVFAIPATRYAIVGVFVKKDIPVLVLNSATKQPISDAWVSLGSYGAYTDSVGRATIRGVATGEYLFGGEKKFFEPIGKVKYVLDIDKKPQLVTITLNPLGRSVNVVLRNKITLAPVPQAKITMGETSGIAGDDGRATIIVRATPTDARGEVKGEITASGYELYRYTRQNEDIDGQAFNVEMVPSDDLYYLSRYNGTVDLVKTKLDGTSKTVILRGTGRESESDTRMSTSVDQRYIALTSIRDGKSPVLHVVAADTKKVAELENEGVTTEQVGWVGHDFVYLAHYKLKPWEAKQHILKSYNADSGKVTTIYETKALGENGDTAASELFSNIALRDGRILYGVYWKAAPGVVISNKVRWINDVNILGEDKKRIKEFTNTTVPIEIKPASPTSVIIRAANNEYYRYDGQKIILDGTIKDANYQSLSTIYYIPAPNGKKFLWSEPANGKFTLKVGDREGKATHMIGVGDYRAYGWVGNDYAILSRSGNELFVIHDKGVFSDKVQPQRTTDYVRPATQNANSGVGYGLW